MSSGILHGDHGSRRRFLREVALATAGVVAGGSVTGCASVATYHGMVDDGSIAVDLAVAETLSAEKGVFLVRAIRASEAILLVRADDGSFSGVGTECTHLGCTVRAGRNALVCPCHGSSFSMQGEVLRGPAQRPLRRYAVVREGAILKVQL